MQAIIQIQAPSLGGVSSRAGAEWTTASPRRTFLGYTALAALMPLIAVHLITLATRMLPAPAEVLPFLT